VVVSPAFERKVSTLLDYEDLVPIINICYHLLSYFLGLPPKGTLAL